MRSFLLRNPDLKLKTSTPITRNRIQPSVNHVDEWFNLINKIIIENNLANRPGQIFNADEIGKTI